MWDEEGSSKGWVPRGERIAEEVLPRLSRHLPGFCGKGGEAILSKTSQRASISTWQRDEWRQEHVSDAGNMFKRAVEQFDQLRRIIMSDLKGIPLVMRTSRPQAHDEVQCSTAGWSSPTLDRGQKDFSGGNVSIGFTYRNRGECGRWWEVAQKSEAILKVKLALLLQ